MDQKGYISTNEYCLPRKVPAKYKTSHTRPGSLVSHHTPTTTTNLLKQHQSTSKTHRFSQNTMSRYRPLSNNATSATGNDGTENYLSLCDQMSTHTRLKQLTRPYKGSCSGGHPSYATGYNPRHFNYLKNSGTYTNSNALNISEEPNLMQITREHREMIRMQRARQVEPHPIRIAEVE